jgi:hypothetical protein
MVQGAAAWYVTGRACPAAAPPLSLSAARVLIVAITIAALIGSVGALLAATRGWRSVAKETSGGVTTVHPPLAEHRRFAAMLASVVGVALTLGLLMAGLPALVFRACGEAR